VPAIDVRLPIRANVGANHAAFVVESASGFSMLTIQIVRLVRAVCSYDGCNRRTVQAILGCFTAIQKPASTSIR
jgi:hypothetical protein